ncbi:MAG: hypothetical protein ISQ08_01485 [Planctomycetes bacterium]|nr:hypothetical protein [Planctomycetota bacterium]
MSVLLVLAGLIAGGPGPVSGSGVPAECLVEGFARKAPLFGHSESQDGLDAPEAEARAKALEDLLLGGRRGGPSLVARLVPLALEDPDRGVRELAREVLASLDTRAAAQALLEVAVTLGGGEGATWIDRLPRSRYAQGPLADFVAGEPEAPLAAAALTVLGELLAAPGAGEEGLTTLAAAPASPDPARAAAGAAGVQALLTGLVARGDAAGLEARGAVLLAGAPRPGVLATRLARVALLTPGGLDLAEAWASLGVRVQAARRAGPHEPREVALEAARAHVLRALVGLAVGGSDAYEGDLRAAEALAYEALGGSDRGPRSPEVAAQRAEALGTLGEVLLTRLFARLLGGLAPGSPEALALATELHSLSLELDVEATLVGGGGANGWDMLLEANASPLQTLVLGRALPGIGPDGGVGAALGVGTALASVSGWELAGFEPAASDESLSIWKDPHREVLLRRALQARVMHATRQEQEVASGALGQPAPFVLPDQDDLLARQLRRWQLSRAMGEAAKPLDERAWRRLRMPASLALWLARDLRNEGRAEESERLARRYAEDLATDASDEEWFLLVQERRVRAALAEGAAATDLDEPVRARTVLLGAVERAEDLLGAVEEREAGPGARRLVEGLLAEALTALAVNSNVKLGRPDEAVAWVERAHELRDDSWSRLLLACYRARAGRGDEARELLRGVRPSPSLHYNLACTYALLGEADAALAWLERELDPAASSPGALRRQKDWAAQDPDLASLRDDSRFKALVE